MIATTLSLSITTSTVMIATALAFTVCRRRRAVGARI
jgi:hypothetical protein